MKKLLLFFSIFSLIITTNNISFIHQNNSHFHQFQYSQNDYLYTDDEIIKEFYEPISFTKEQKNGLLFIPKKYNTRLELQFANEDLNLIKKEILEVKIEFDLKISWEGQKQSFKNLDVHLYQWLDFQHLQKSLVCGTILWQSSFFNELKIKPLIDFSWENQVLILEHKNNEFLNYDQLVQLSLIEGNGLTKMNFQLTNLRLIYQIPKIFNQLTKINLNLEYWIDLNSFSQINEIIAQAILNDYELKKLKFTNYFNNPILTIEQKENLLKIGDDFQVNLQCFLQLKPRYQEDILYPLLKKFYLNINFFQCINLNKLVLNEQLKINESDNPWQIFVNQNLNYKSFFINYCDFEINNNYLLISPKKEYPNLRGSLNLLIEYNQIFKRSLNKLNLKTDLGIFELENRNQFIQAKDIFKRWKEYNENILREEEITDYLIEQQSSNRESFLISAQKKNQNFEGFSQVNLKIIYLEDQENKSKPFLESKPNFLKKYWWILILVIFILAVILWFIIKIFKDKKTDKS